MKIINVLGSPKKKGNTATVLSLFETMAGQHHEIERIYISRYAVGGCLGCMKCKENEGAPGCVQSDDAIAIFEKMIAADAIVYASPLYCWSFTSQIKPLIDRHFCLVKQDGTPEHNSLLRGKPAALLVTCAGPIEGNCDPIRMIFDGFADYVQLDNRGSHIVPFCTTPGAIGEDGHAVAAALSNAIGT